MNAEPAGHAGPPQLKQLNMVNIKMWYHPKYYKELKKQSTLSKRSVTKNNSSHVDQEDQAALGSLPALDPQSDQAISLRARDGECARATGPGLKLPGPRPISNANKGLIHRRQATSSQASSDKPQAPSNKRQAPSRKLQADES